MRAGGGGQGDPGGGRPGPLRVQGSLIPQSGDETAARPRWWVEVLIIAVFYGVYSLIRDLHGDNSENVGQATSNAHAIIHLEQNLGVFDEQHVQHVFIHFHSFISILDDFYGSAHFLAVGGVLLWLFFARPQFYRRWRNTLAICTGLALIGFAFYPVLPPRLLPFARYHIVDTLRVVGGLWNFSSGPANDVSNQYAAMPSLHTGWSTWSALAVASACRSRWTKVAVFIYPALTIFCIVVTGNHYFADALGGLVALGLGYGGAILVAHRPPRGSRRRDGGQEASSLADTPAPASAGAVRAQESL